MKLIPAVKEAKKGVRTEISGSTFIFPENCDKRVINLAKTLKLLHICKKCSTFAADFNMREYALAFDKWVA